MSVVACIDLFSFLSFPADHLLKQAQENTGFLTNMPLAYVHVDLGCPLAHPHATRGAFYSGVWPDCSI